MPAGSRPGVFVAPNSNSPQKSAERLARSAAAMSDAATLAEYLGLENEIINFDTPLTQWLACHRKRRQFNVMFGSPFSLLRNLYQKIFSQNVGNSSAIY